MTKPITEDDVCRSLELHGLLEVCRGAAEHLSDKLEKDRETQNLAGAMPAALALAIEKWGAVHDALEGAHDYGAKPAGEDDQP